MIWRVRDRATFEALARARRWRRGPLTLRYLDDADGHPPRVAYAIGRPVGGSVRRNRVRRRLRSAVHELRDELRSGAYLIGAGPEALTMPFDALRTQLRELLDDAGALR